VEKNIDLKKMSNEYFDRMIAVITGEIFLVAAFMHLDFSSWMPDLIAFLVKCLAAGIMAFVGGFLSVIGKDVWYFLRDKIKLWRKK
jgi:hypothetical protein